MPILELHWKGMSRGGHSGKKEWNAKQWRSEPDYLEGTERWDTVDVRCMVPTRIFLLLAAAPIRQALADFINLTKYKMGIDLVAGGRRKGHNVRKAPASKNVYIKLLEKLYGYVHQCRDYCLFTSWWTYCFCISLFYLGEYMFQIVYHSTINFILTSILFLTLLRWWSLAPL